MKRSVLALMSTLVVLGSAGCAAGQASAPQTAVLPVGQTDRVSMAKSYRFEPVQLEVPAGATVTWVNDDNFTHNVQFSGARGWTSPSLKPGESASYTFETPGEYEYQCVFHSQNMRGRIEVVSR